MKFKYPVDNPTTEITLPGNLLPNSERYRTKQIREFTKGGSPVVYNDSPDQRYIQIKLRLTQTEKDKLVSFLKDIVQWSLHEFLFEDGESIYEKVVRFWSDELKIKRDFMNYYIVEFELLYLRDNLL